MDIHGLPSNERDLAECLIEGISAAQSARAIEEVTWDITRWWLRGVREFDQVDTATGLVVPFHCDPNELLVLDEALSDAQEEIGRLMRMDLRPAVEACGFGLDASRNAALAHATLAYLESRMNHDAVKQAKITHDVYFGTVGTYLDEGVEAPPRKGEESEFRRREWVPRHDVVPAWQLLGMPGNAADSRAVTAIGRQRMVPLDWLKAVTQGGSELVRPAMKLPHGLSESDLDIHEVPFGSSVLEGLSGSSGGDGGIWASIRQQLGEMLGTSEKKRDRKRIKYVRMDEIWFTSDQETLDRYCILIGNKHLAANIDFWKLGVRRPMPIAIARYADVGGFYGRSFVWGRRQINAIRERMLEALVRNIEDIDVYGITLLPRTGGINRRDFLRPRDGGPRVATWEPDPMVPSAGPVQIQPTNSGGLPSQVAGVMGDVKSTVFSQRSVFSDDAPRRMDSAAAMRYVDGAANEARTPAASSLANADALVWGATLNAAKRKYGTQGVIPLVMLDDAIVGVRYDPEKGAVRLDENGIPDFWEVRVKTRSQMPVNPEMAVAWLDEQHKAGRITDREFRIEVRKLGLPGLPLANEAEWNAYRKCMLNIIQVFNDGKTPGKYTLLPEHDLLELHQHYVQAFMASDRLAYASEAVQTQFQNLARDIKGNMGMPDGQPYLEDAAEMEQAMARMGGAGGMNLANMAQAFAPNAA